MSESSFKMCADICLATAGDFSWGVCSPVQGSDGDDCVLNKPFLLGGLEHDTTPEGFIKVFSKVWSAGVTEYLEILKVLIVGEPPLRKGWP